jgi:hypothetical protein
MKAPKFALLVLTVLSAGVTTAQAGVLFITPVFSTGTTSAIDTAIDSAISTLEGLYATPTASSLTITVTFTYTPGAAGNLESTSQDDYIIPYSAYKNALQTDSTENPLNTVLATALANLSSGNDASGTGDVAVTGALLAMLGLGPASDSNATININSNQTFSDGRPVPSNEFDLIGGLEHELDEVLGGGGGGSTLNALADGACTPGSMYAAFCGTYGPLDLYRYSAFDTPSFSDVSSTTSISYLSINGGLTSVVAFNQNTSGDMADFYPNCGTGSGTLQLIQNAFNCTGQDEAYTTSSPEFTMEQAIGWDPTAADAAPEPGTLGLLGASLVALALGRKRLRRK